jgi:hypothetical protein
LGVAEDESLSIDIFRRNASHSPKPNRILYETYEEKVPGSRQAKQKHSTKDAFNFKALIAVSTADEKPSSCIYNQA